MALSVKDFHREKLWGRMSSVMGQKAIVIPVFILNEEQMDILYPPRYKKAFNPDRLKRLLKDRDFDIDRLDEGDWNTYAKIVTVGLYVSSPSLPSDEEVLKKSNGVEITPEAEKAYLHQEGPRIYICGERVVNWASKVGCHHHLVLDKVYYHELGHAVMDTYEGPGSDDPYFTNWGRTIEECAANHIAYSCFSGVEARFVQKLISRQPAEYLGYLGLRRIQPFPLPVERPGRWDSDDQNHHKEFLRRFFEEEMDWMDWSGVGRLGLPHRWLLDWRQAREVAMRRIRHRDWDWDDVWHFMREHGFPPFPFFGGGPWGGWIPGNEENAAIASQNISLWSRYKARGAPRHPEYVILLKEWATYLLRVGVMD